MTKQQLKQLLASYSYDNKYLAAKLNNLEKIRNQTERLNKAYGNPQPVSASGLPQQDDKLISSLIAKKQAIDGLINSLPQPYKTIMFLRYICMYTFDQIAKDMNYSTKRIYQLHSKAIDLLLQDHSGTIHNISTI